MYLTMWQAMQWKISLKEKFLYYWLCIFTEKNAAELKFIIIFMIFKNYL